MVYKPYCKLNYARCICSSCKSDKDNCCGKAYFSTYLCPTVHCPEYKEKPRVRQKEGRVNG